MAKTAPLWAYVDVRPSNVDKKTKTDEPTVRLVNYTDVYYNQEITADLDLMIATASTDHIDRFGVARGDIIITKDSESPDDIGIPAIVSQADPDMVCAYHLTLLRPDLETASPRYLYWVLESELAKQHWLTNSYGVTRYSILTGAVSRMRVPHYSVPAQQRIADYLDRETGEIDAMIAKMDQLAEQLESRRLAAIDRAFADLCGARNASAHLVADITVGIVIEPAKLYVSSGQGVPALRGINIAPGHIKSDDLVEISHQGHAANLKSELQTGDLVTVRTGRVGTTAVIPDGWAGSNAIDLVITRPHAGQSARYLYWLLCSSEARSHIEGQSVGAVQSHLNVTGLKRLPVPVIPVGQQERIADHLDEVTNKIDAMLAKVAELKSLLTERRAALITEVVTGRKDVA